SFPHPSSSPNEQTFAMRALKLGIAPSLLLLPCLCLFGVIWPVPADRVPTAGEIGDYDDPVLKEIFSNTAPPPPPYNTALYQTSHAPPPLLQQSQQKPPAGGSRSKSQSSHS